MTEPSLRLSVIIVEYRSGGHLSEVLRSLSAAPPAVPWEILVVDNGSGEDERIGCALAQFGAPSGLASELNGPAAAGRCLPKPQLVRLPANRGFAAGCNAGLRSARGRWLLVLNPDVRVSVGAIDALLRFGEAHPECGAVAPQLLNPDGSLQPSRGSFPNLVRTLVHLAGLRRWFPRDEPAIAALGEWGGKLAAQWGKFDSPHPVDYATGACLLLRRAALEDVGFLDEGFFLFYEEIDWCRRAAARGWQCYFEPAARVVHVGGGSSAECSQTVFSARYRSLQRYFDKHRPVSEALLLRALLRLALPLLRNRRPTAAPRPLWPPGCGSPPAPLA